MSHVYRSISIIVPVFNESKFIKKTIQEIIKADTMSLKKEIIIVDDASTDDSAKIVRQMIKRYKKELRLIEKKINEGKGACLKKGIRECKGDIVLIQDADLEYSPDDYPSIIEPFFHYRADVVYGSRFVSTRPRRILYFWHYFANIILTLYSNMLTNLNLTDMETGYKAFRGDLIREIASRLRSKRFGFEPEITAIISKIKNLKIYEVGITYQGRTYEEGKKITWKDGLKAFWEVTKYNLLE